MQVEQFCITQKSLRFKRKNSFKERSVVQRTDMSYCVPPAVPIGSWDHTVRSVTHCARLARMTRITSKHPEYNVEILKVHFPSVNSSVFELREITANSQNKCHWLSEQGILHHHHVWWWSWSTVQLFSIWLKPSSVYVQIYFMWIWYDVFPITYTRTSSRCFPYRYLLPYHFHQCFTMDLVHVSCSAQSLMFVFSHYISIIIHSSDFVICSDLILIRGHVLVGSETLSRTSRFSIDFVVCLCPCPSYVLLSK